MRSFTTDSFEFINYVDMPNNMSTIVWKCRNLPEIRKWMVNKDLISYQDHKMFISHLLDDDNRKYFCILRNGVFVGSINIQYANSPETVERGIYIHPNFWGQKYAKKICQEFYSYMRDNFGIKDITTKVFKENRASNALETSLGAKIIAEDTKFNYYQCDLTTI